MSLSVISVKSMYNFHFATRRQSCLWYRKLITFLCEWCLLSINNTVGTNNHSSIRRPALKVIEISLVSRSPFSSPLSQSSFLISLLKAVMISRPIIPTRIRLTFRIKDVKDAVHFLGMKFYLLGFCSRANLRWLIRVLVLPVADCVESENLCFPAGVGVGGNGKGLCSWEP